MGLAQNMGFGCISINQKNIFNVDILKKNQEGEVFWCVYDKRVDHHRDCLGVHVHKNQKKVKKGPLDIHLQQSTHFGSRNDIYLKLAHYPAASNISLKNGCPDSMLNIIYSSLTYYKKNYQKFVNIPPERIVPKIGPEKIGELIIDSANQMLSKSISHLQYSNYISICLDGGQVAQRHFIDFVA